MKLEIKPAILISAAVGVLAVIALVVFLANQHNEEANPSARNKQIMNQMQQVGATAGASSAAQGAASPEAMRMRQMGGMAPGGMAPGGMTPGGMTQPGR